MANKANQQKQINEIDKLYNEFIFDDVNKYMKLFNMKDRGAADKRLDNIKKIREKAICNKDNRNFIVNEYTKVLMALYFNDKTKDKRDINDYIDFEDLLNNCDFIKFEMTLIIKDFKDMVYEHNIDYIFTSQKLNEIFELLKDDINKKFQSMSNKVNFLALILFIINDGQDVIDTLQYHNVSDVAHLSHDYIYTIIGEETYYIKFLKFNRSDISNVLFKISDSKFSEGNPHILTDKASGSRVIITGHKFTPRQDFYYNERIFNIPFMSLDFLENEKKTLDHNIHHFLKLHVESLGKTIISGNNTNVGKTTLMIAMIGSMLQKHGLGLLDSNDETLLRLRFPEKNIITLLANEDEDITMLMEALFKYSRRFIGVGEIVKPIHAANLISLTKAFDSGIFATIHSAKVDYVVDNLTDKMLRTSVYNDRELAEIHAADVLSIIIHLERHREDQNRIVISSICEVIPLRDKYVFKPNFSNKRNMISNLLKMGQAAIYKKIYKMNYDIETLFKYDYDTDTWNILKEPSDDYFERFDYYIKDKEKMAKMRELFSKNKKRQPDASSRMENLL